MTRMSVPLVVVMPVYEDSPSATELIKQLAAQCPVAPYIVALEDGSIRQPLSPESISAAGLSGEILHLVRNMGHQRAIAAGLSYVANTLDADAVVVMDSDGEDRPDSVAALLDELRRPDVDVVVARRRKRSEALSFRVFYAFYRVLFHVLTGRTIRFGNFTALSATAVRRLAAMQELWVHFAASVMISKLRIGVVPTDRGVRYAGRSKMNFIALILHGLRSIMVFAEDVLVRVGVLCVVLAVVAVLALGTAVLLKLVGFATPGWYSTASGILIIILMQSGILMFTTLMVSGVVRSAPPLTKAQVDLLVERVERVRQLPTAPDDACLASVIEVCESIPLVPLDDADLLSPEPGASITRQSAD